MFSRAGTATGVQLAAALAMGAWLKPTAKNRCFRGHARTQGAEGVNMGTRFMATKEASFDSTLHRRFMHTTAPRECIFLWAAVQALAGMQLTSTRDLSVADMAEAPIVQPMKDVMVKAKVTDRLHSVRHCNLE